MTGYSTHAFSNNYEDAGPSQDVVPDEPNAHCINGHVSRNPSNEGLVDNNTAVTGGDEMHEVAAPSNALGERFENASWKFSGNWSEEYNIHEAQVTDATQACLSPAPTAIVSPPRMRLPDISLKWLAMFKIEEFKIWCDGTPDGPCAFGVDDFKVGMLAQAAMEAAFVNVPKDLYQIAGISRAFYNRLWTEGHPKYGPFIPGVCTNGVAEDTVFVSELANKNTQWKILSEDLRSMSTWTRPSLKGMEPKRSDTEKSVFRENEGRLPHHINFNGQYIYKRSYTPPPVSLWAMSTTMWKDPFPNRKKCPTVHRKSVLMSQAFKYVDPVRYLGGDAPLPVEQVDGQARNLHGSRLRNAVTCNVEVVYDPYGTWVADWYEQDDVEPVVWQEGDRCHDARMKQYVHLQPPYFVNPRHDEHNQCNINDDAFPKPRVHHRALKRKNGYSPLWKVLLKETNDVEISFTWNGRSWHGTLIRRDTDVEDDVAVEVPPDSDAASSEAETELEDGKHEPARFCVDLKDSGGLDFSQVTTDPTTWPPPSQWPEDWPKPNMGYSNVSGWSPYVRCSEVKESLLKKLSASIGKPYPEEGTPKESEV